MIHEIFKKKHICHRYFQKIGRNPGLVNAKMLWDRELKKGRKIDLDALNSVFEDIRTEQQELLVKNVDKIK